MASYFEEDGGMDDSFVVVKNKGNDESMNMSITTFNQSSLFSNDDSLVKHFVSKVLSKPGATVDDFKLPIRPVLNLIPNTIFKVVASPHSEIEKQKDRGI